MLETARALVLTTCGDSPLENLDYPGLRTGRNGNQSLSSIENKPLRVKE